MFMTQNKSFGGVKQSKTQNSFYKENKREFGVRPATSLNETMLKFKARDLKSRNGSSQACTPLVETETLNPTFREVRLA
jgi:hypothetical protein